MPKQYPKEVTYMPKNKNLIIEFWGFMKQNKAWWLAPIIIMLIIVGLLIIFQGSAISPFIYALM